MPPKLKSPPPPPPHGPVVVVPPPPYRRRLEIIDLPQGAAAPTTPTPGKWQLPRVPIAFIALYFIVLVYASDLSLSQSKKYKLCSSSDACSLFAIDVQRGEVQPPHSSSGELLTNLCIDLWICLLTAASSSRALTLLAACSRRIVLSGSDTQLARPIYLAFFLG